MFSSKLLGTTDTKVSPGQVIDEARRLAQHLLDRGATVSALSREVQIPAKVVSRDVLGAFGQLG